MNRSEAKSLVELQACITYLLDKFLIEVEQLEESKAKASLKKTTVEIIGTCVTDVVLPIASEHPSLNIYEADRNPLIAQWIDRARKRRFTDAASGT